MTALNPVFTIENQMVDVLRRHKGLSKSEAQKEAVEMLETVGIPSPGRRIKEYPHQLSGGMRQRVMIAMALSCEPSLLLADEPTTALDVTIQAQVMEEMAIMQEKLKMATILVTHDLAVIAEFCEKVIVMYCGHIVEMASVGELYKNPKHPYTRGLLNSIPRIRESKVKELPTIEGTVPDLANLPQGCRFSDRCEKSTAICREKPPALSFQGTHGVACYNPY
jgi:peptide/nickel transport system ATP-binding protein